MKYQNITGVILAGGQSRRMKTGDKAFAELYGKPLVEYAIENLTAQVGNIIISANQSIDRFSKYGVSVLPDYIGNHYGPLAGIYSASLACKTDYILAVPCDTPFAPGDLAIRTLEKLTLHNAELCMAYDGNRIHPVFMLLRRELAPSILEYLYAGNRKTADWAMSHRYVVADFSDHAGAFININTPQELDDIDNSKYLFRAGEKKG